MPSEAARAFGWVRDAPDLRDFFIDLHEGGEIPVDALHMEVQPDERTRLLGLMNKISFPYPPPHESFRNAQWCSPVQDQGSLGSCTAQAGVGVLEYYERRACGKHIDASNRFLYKVTRKLLGWTGDTGAYCRTTMGALSCFGVPPEKYFPYTTRQHPGPANEPTFDDEPPAFLYAFAQNFQGLIYHRLDMPGAKLSLLTRIKMMVAVGWTPMFGFSVYESYGQATDTGEIPYPTTKERRVGGHAIIAVGYDDDKEIKNELPDGPETKGAFLIKNSWGTDWGCKPPEYGVERGYGWLPYKYVEDGLAVDWWTLTKAEWLDMGVFGV